MANKTKDNIIEHAKDDARNAMKTAKSEFNKAQATVKNYMKDNPVKAAMIAAALGAAIGVATIALMKRRKKGEE